jgi:hypothetical protein
MLMEISMMDSGKMIKLTVMEFIDMQMDPVMKVIGKKISSTVKG